MNYRVTHTTIYHYSQTVGLCQNEARLKPQHFAHQSCSSSLIEINPLPADFRGRTDYFGNYVAYFAIQQPHTQLSVSAISDVTVFARPALTESDADISWEQVRERLPAMPAQTPNVQSGLEMTGELINARLCLLDSPMVTVTPDLTAYAQASFQPGRPLLETVLDLMGRIYRDFTYDPAFTTIATPLSEVLSHRRGVCQDFAHLAIGCLRAYGIAARYISGYVETYAKPGQARLVGADASHAWFSVYMPPVGWLDFDPTNNIMPSDQHITLAWGRDYSDVTPLKGIALGGGQHTLYVSVDVQRIN